MARKKSVEDRDDGASILDKVNKQVGGAFELKSYAPSDPSFHIPYWISTGAPDLDGKLGGGIAGGRVIEIYSTAPSEGKTAVAATIARECQRAGGQVVYFDAEHTFMPGYYVKFGLDVDRRFLITQCPPLETIFKQIAAYSEHYRASVNEDNPLLFIVDSLAACVPESLADKSNFDTPGIAIQARVLGNCLMQILPMLGKRRATLVMLNQGRVQIGVYGSGTNTPGGSAFKYYATQRIALHKVKPTITHDGTEKGVPLGITVEATVVKNKVAPPFQKSRFGLLFDTGVLYEDSAFELLLFRGGIVPKGGPGHYVLTESGDKVTRPTFSEYVAAHPEIRDLVAKFVATPYVATPAASELPEETAG